MELDDKQKGNLPYPAPGDGPKEPITGLEQTPEEKAAPVADTNRPADTKQPGEAPNVGYEPEETKKLKAEIVKNLSESVQFKFTEDQLGKLFESEGLTDEFKKAATEIFEAAVNTAIRSKIDDVMGIMEQLVDAGLKSYAEKTDKILESHMDTVANEWYSRNKVAVESNLRLQTAESFMAGLKSLFESHWITVPEDKVDLFEGAVAKVTELESTLTAKSEQTNLLEGEIKALKKQLITEQFVAGKTQVKAEKLKALVESVQFETEEQFKGVLTTFDANFQDESAPTLVIESAPVEEPKEAPKAVEQEAAPLNEGASDPKPEVDEISLLASFIAEQQRRLNYGK